MLKSLGLLLNTKTGETNMEKKITYINSKGKKITATVKKVNDDCFAVDLGMKGSSWMMVTNSPFLGFSEDFSIIKKAYEMEE